METYKIMDFGKISSLSSEAMKTEGQQLLDKIFDSDTEIKIAIKISKVNSKGYRDSCNIVIFNSMNDASKTINIHEYCGREYVEVFEISKKGYLHLFYKTHDSTNYTRLAQPEFEEYNLSTIRDLYDTEAQIYINI